MRFQAFLTGIEPRSECLIKKIRSFEQGRISKEIMENELKREEDEDILLQINAGLTQIIDPMIRWNDLLRPFTEKLQGVIVGGLTRFYENNIFYKRPLVSRRLSIKERILTNYIRLDIIPDDKGRLILPSPLTFADLAQILDGRHYSSKEDLMLDFAEVLAEELRQLPRNKISSIQLSEPSLVAKEWDSEVLKKLSYCIQRIASAYLGRIYLHSYFGDISKIYPLILDFKVDSVGVDFTETDVKLLSQYATDKEITCGIVDARSSRIEGVDEIVSKAKLIADKLDAKAVAVTPNCDLDFLPKEIAKMKIINLGEALKKLRDGVD